MTTIVIVAISYALGVVVPPLQLWEWALKARDAIKERQ